MAQAQTTNQETVQTKSKVGYTPISNIIWTGHAAAMKSALPTFQFLLQYQNCKSIYPSLLHIAKGTGLCRQTIKTHLIKLRDLDYIRFTLSQRGTFWHRDFIITDKIFQIYPVAPVSPQKAPDITPADISTPPMAPDSESPPPVSSSPSISTPMPKQDTVLEPPLPSLVAEAQTETKAASISEVKKLNVDVKLFNIHNTKSSNTKRIKNSSTEGEGISRSGGTRQPEPLTEPQKPKPHFIPASLTLQISKKNAELLSLPDKDIIDSLPTILSDYETADSLDADIWTILRDRSHPANPALTHKLLALSELLEKASSQEIDKILPVLKERGIENLTYARGVFRQAFR